MPDIPGIPDIPLPVIPGLPKLGKKTAKLIKGLPALGSYTLHLKASPPEADYSLAIKRRPLFGNDKLGDCTCAQGAHAIQLWTSLTQENETVLTDKAVIDFYSKTCGYVVGDQYTDSGGILADVLKYWYLNGYDGHKLAGFASIRPGNRASVRDSIYLFGAVSLGLQLPLTVQNATFWDVSPDVPLTGNAEPGSWGGHAALGVAYTPDYLLIYTWDKFIKATWSWVDRYMDEAFALLSPDWINLSGNAPPGFDLASLQADMQAIKGA